MTPLALAPVATCPATDPAAPLAAWGRRFGIVHYASSDPGDDVTGLAVGPDGRLAVAGAGGFRLWDPDGTPRAWHPDDARAVAFAPDGTLWVGGAELTRAPSTMPRDTPVLLHVDAAGRELARVSFAGSWTGRVDAVAVRPDGDVAVAGTCTAGIVLGEARPAGGGDDAFVARLAPDGSVRWGALVATEEHDRALDLALGADGAVIVLVERSDAVNSSLRAPRERITWSADGVESARADATGVLDLAALPGGALAAARIDGLVRIGPDGGEAPLPTPPLDGLHVGAIAGGSDGSLLVAAVPDARSRAPGAALVFATAPEGVRWALRVAGRPPPDGAAFGHLALLAPQPLPGGGIALAGTLQGSLETCGGPPVRLDAASEVATDGFLIGYRAP